MIEVDDGVVAFAVFLKEIPNDGPAAADVVPIKTCVGCAIQEQ